MNMMMATTNAFPTTLPIDIKTSKTTCMYTSTSLLNEVAGAVESVAFSWSTWVKFILTFSRSLPFSATSIRDSLAQFKSEKNGSINSNHWRLCLQFSEKEKFVLMFACD